MENLKATYCRQKSFYGKAKVKRENDRIKLISYTTTVAEIQDGQVKIFGWYSKTTTRHIKEFLQQNGFMIGTKAELEKMYC